MSIPLTRAQARDTIRRSFLGITPPIDSGTGGVGDAPANRPDPSNAVLNDNIVQSLAELARKCEFKENPSFVISVAAHVGNGPLSIPLFNSGAVPVEPTLQPGAINSIRRVWWDDGSGNLQQLLPTSLQQYDRNNSLLENVAPSTPRWFYLEGYAIGITPAPATAGNLHMIGGISPFAPQSDTEMITDMPSDYQYGVWRGAAILWWRSRLPNGDAAAKLALHEPLWLAEQEDLRAWNVDKNFNYQETIGCDTYRRGQGLQNNRR